MADFTYKDWLNWRWGEEGPERRANLEEFVRNSKTEIRQDAEVLVREEMRQAANSGRPSDVATLATRLIEQLRALTPEVIQLESGFLQALRPARSVNPSNIAGRGWEPELSLQVVSVDNVGRLLEVRRWGAPIGRLVELQDPKDNQAVFLCVDPSVQSPKEAVAWTFGLDAEDYAPEVET